MDLLSIKVSQTDPAGDPRKILVRIDEPSQSEWPSKLPFDERVALRAVLKSLEATTFAREDFTQEELDWLQSQQLLVGSPEDLSYSPKLRNEIGKKLFCCLFPSETMRSIYDEVRRNTDAASKEIHFQLCFSAQAPLVGTYPWELLYHDQDFLIGGGKGTLTRYVTFDTPPPFRAVSGQLKALLVAPRPSDPELALLGSAEAQAIRRGLESATGQIIVEPQEVSSFAALGDYLSKHSGDEAPHIIHFDGHGAFGRRCPQCKWITTGRTAAQCSNPGCSRTLKDVEPQGFLAFEDRQRRTDYRSAREFADLLRQALVVGEGGAQGGTRLVVLSACRSGEARSAESVFNGVAQRLMDARVPAVVAMQFSIQTGAAAEFVELFYGRVAQRDPLVTAVSWGRTALGREGDQWYRPVLYLRWRDNDDGQLFATSSILSSPLLPPPTVPKDGQSVLTGLSALAALAQENPEARVAVSGFCSGCETTCEQLEVVHDYKSLHDLLHDIQILCYDPLKDLVPRFLVDDEAMEDVMRHQVTLQGTIGELRTEAEQKTLDTMETSWIQDVSTAHDMLAAAIDGRDAAQLNKAIWLLHHVLAVQPDRINVALKEAARATRLPDLVAKLTGVHNYLKPLNLDPEKMGQFTRGLVALDRFSHSLPELVTDHDLWQKLDVELRLVEDTMGQGVADLEMSWPLLKVKASRVCGNDGAEWAANLRKFGAALDQALAAQDQPKIKSQFHRYRWQAADRFFRVDKDLKKQCEELAQIGKSLTAVMELIR
jgi:hypothetical protein